MTLSINHKKLKDRVIEMERNMHRLEQYSRRECIEIAEVQHHKLLSQRTRDSNF